MKTKIDKRFVKMQEGRIQARLQRYNNPKIAEEQLRERGDLTLYQRYKINIVSPYLYKALEKIHAGTYGNCDVCGCEIPTDRLKLVPAALTCVGCDPCK